MLPLSLLTTAQGSPMLVELKSGETYNGHLMQCDNYMNLTLREVIQTSREGDRFFRLPEVYIRGNNIKYLRVPEDTLDKVRDRERAEYQARTRGNFNQNGRGRGGGRGNSRGGGERGGRGRGGRQ